MNYCTIDEAWGNNNFKESRKKKKTKRLYTSQIPPHITDTSYEEGSKDPHCESNHKKNFTVKNKNRYDKSRGPKDIYRPKRSSRVNNINLRYDEAKKEYKRYKKETKRNAKQPLEKQDIIENDHYPPIFSNNMDYMNMEEEENYAPIQENDMELASLPPGMDMNNSYIIEDNDRIQAKMLKLQQEQGKVLEEQRQVVEQQMAQRGMLNQVESFDNYYTNNNIEAFEGEGNMLDTMRYEGNTDVETDQEIQDVDEVPSESANENQKTNYVDQMIQNKESDVESDEESEADSEDNLEVVKKNDDLEKRLHNLNKNVNLIIKKMNRNEVFNEDAKENIHDLVLFALFGIFIIFVLDTVYRFGKQHRS